VLPAIVKEKSCIQPCRASLYWANIPYSCW